MLKGTREQNGGEPRAQHHVTLTEPELMDDVDAGRDVTDDEKSILLKRMTISDDSGGENSPVPNGSSVSLNTGSTVLMGQSEEQLDTTCLGKTKRFLRVAYKVIKSVAGLLFLLIAYSFLGAFIFMTIESETVYEKRLNITAERTLLIGRLQQMSEELADSSLTVDQWKQDLQGMLANYETVAREAAMVEDNTTGRDKWDFWNSLFFVGTVYTTIGYGHLAPSTDVGKVVCIFYASVGIPLALLCLAELGKRFTVGLKFLWAYIRRFYYHGTCRKLRKPFKQKYDMSEEHPEHSEVENKSMGDRSRSGSRIIYGYEVDDEFNLPITFALGVVVVYVVLGGMMYSIWEEWDFIDAIYFVFISISTVGFGDILPAHPKFFMMSFVYLFIGLSLVSMVINVAIEFFTKTVDQAKQKMIDAKHKMEEAKDKIGQKVNKAGKNVKEKAAGIKTNIMDETQKIVKKTDEKFRKRSRSSTPVNLDSVTEEGNDKRAPKQEDNKV